ncbi:hypothetical protein H696_05612 [Fonticula alba]|uniref:Uncharacterized protein n=1 Tax=Fonticula alba TaxID=691883 RepID=A0A058Z1S6_FONAL|nr:hypothetical protein H696_05612 [Fonticula alba]KCV67883.1 hypothetical protein H696_05612 [Fonticula alba]|eukprot:XP_009497703.1 hypothetical protein H696_05612 [Fonticula alba]
MSLQMPPSQGGQGPSPAAHDILSEEAALQASLDLLRIERLFASPPSRSGRPVQLFAQLLLTAGRRVTVRLDHILPRHRAVLHASVWLWALAERPGARGGGPASGDSSDEASRIIHFTLGDLVSNNHDFIWNTITNFNGADARPGPAYIAALIYSLLQPQPKAQTVHAERKCFAIRLLMGSMYSVQPMIEAFDAFFARRLPDRGSFEEILLRVDPDRYPLSAGEAVLEDFPRVRSRASTPTPSKRPRLGVRSPRAPVLAAAELELDFTDFHQPQGKASMHFLPTSARGSTGAVHLSAFQHFVELFADCALAELAAAYRCPGHFPLRTGALCRLVTRWHANSRYPDHLMGLLARAEHLPESLVRGLMRLLTGCLAVELLAGMPTKMTEMAALCLARADAADRAHLLSYVPIHAVRLELAERMFAHSHASLRPVCDVLAFRPLLAGRSTPSPAAAARLLFCDFCLESHATGPARAPALDASQAAILAHDSVAASAAETASLFLDAWFGHCTAFRQHFVSSIGPRVFNRTYPPRGLTLQECPHARTLLQRVRNLSSLHVAFAECLAAAARMLDSPAMTPAPRTATRDFPGALPPSTILSPEATRRHLGIADPFPPGWERRATAARAPNK